MASSIKKQQQSSGSKVSYDDDSSSASFDSPDEDEDDDFDLAPNKSDGSDLETFQPSPKESKESSLLETRGNKGTDTQPCTAIDLTGDEDYVASGATSTPRSKTQPRARKVSMSPKDSLATTGNKPKPTKPSSKRKGETADNTSRKKKKIKSSKAKAAKKGRDDKEKLPTTSKCNKSPQTEVAVKISSKEKVATDDKLSTMGRNPFKDKSSAVAASTEKILPVKKHKKRSFQDKLLHLLFISCKPYTLKSLAAALKTNETSVQHCILSLKDKGWVIMKEFTSKGGNRSKELFWVNQNATKKSHELQEALQVASPREVQEAKQELEQLYGQYTTLVKEFDFVSQEPSNSELTGSLKLAEEEFRCLVSKRDDALARIKSLKESGAGSSLHSSKKPGGFGKKVKAHKALTTMAIKTKINNMREEWKRRRDKCMDFVDQLADGMEKKRKDVIRMLGLETDEMVGVKLPPKFALEK